MRIEMLRLLRRSDNLLNSRMPTYLLDGTKLLEHTSKSTWLHFSLFGNVAAVQPPAHPRCQLVLRVSAFRTSTRPMRFASMFQRIAHAYTFSEFKHAPPFTSSPLDELPSREAVS